MPSRDIRDQREEEPEEETVNPLRGKLQLKIDENMERRLVEIIRSDYDAAKQARNDKDYGISSKGEKLNFTSWYRGLKDLYNARREPKTVPWKFASNRSLRLATAIVDTIHARIYPTIVNQELLKWNPGEVKDTPKVDRIDKLMNWWVWVRSKMQGFFDIWLKTCVGFGDAMTETIWVKDIVSVGSTIQIPIQDETGQPVVNEETGQPETMPIKDIRFEEKTASRIYMRDQVFLQEGSKDIQKEPVILEDEILYRDLLQGEDEGLFVNVSTVLRNRIPVESVPGQTEEERERLRDIKLRNKKVKIQKWYSDFDSDGDGFAECVRVIVSLEHDVYLGGIQCSNLTKSGKKPLHYQKLDNRLDRPEENDGEGIIEKIKELAEEIDAIFNQLTDANTLSILRPMFYDPGGDLDAPVLKLAPNRGIPVSDPQRNVLFPDISVDISRLIEAIRLVLEFVERLTAASAFVFGKEGEFAGGSGTATRTNAILQSAETRFARPAERLRSGTAEIIKQHLDMLQLNIPPGLETRVLGEKGEPVFDTNELTKDGISGEFDAYLLPDPSMGSKQLTRDLSMMFYQLLLQNPLVGSDPVKIYKITADLLKSWDKNPEEFLGPAPTADDIDSPEDENTLIVQGDFTRVRAQITENHIHHIQQHMALIQSPSLAQMPPHFIEQVVQFTQAHIQEHQQQLQLMIGIAQKFGGGGGASNGPNARGEGPNDPSSQGNDGQPGLAEATGAAGQTLTTKRDGESRAT